MKFADRMQLTVEEFVILLHLNKNCFCAQLCLFLTLILFLNKRCYHLSITRIQYTFIIIYIKDLNDKERQELDLQIVALSEVVSDLMKSQINTSNSELLEIIHFYISPNYLIKEYNCNKHFSKHFCFKL